MFTDRERQILEVLKDGRRHFKQTIFENLFTDENFRPQATITALEQQVSNLRKKMEPMGETILCERYNHRSHYRWVRLLRGSGG